MYFERIYVNTDGRANIGRASRIARRHRQRVRGWIHHRRRSRAATGRRPDGCADRRNLRPDRGRGGAVLRLVRQNRAGRHALFAGRQPVEQRRRQGQCDHQLSFVDRPHRPARHGAVLADRTTQRHGRPGSRRAGQSTCRPHGDRKPATPRHRPALLAVACHRG